MRLVSMDVENFGPYRGRQTFTFASQSGVELVWGENGRGKTSFLNALRWALFGEILGRASAIIDPATVGNRDDSEAGAIKAFKVILNFTHDGQAYKLTRAYQPDPAGAKKATSLVKNGDVLGPDEREHELNLLLPQQIARFFLFDAELLQEYEQLLDAGNDAGQRLKEAIERILGLPVLTHTRDDLASQLKEARTAQAKAAQKDRATRDLGNNLQLANDEAENARNNEKELTDLRDDAQNSVNELERQLAANSRYRSLIATRDAKRDEVKRLSDRATERADDLAEAAGDTWRAVLAPTVEAELGQLQDATDALTSRLTSAMAARQVHLAIATGTCPTCHQDLAPETAAALTEHPTEDVDALSTQLAALRVRRDALRTFKTDTDRIIRLEREEQQARVDLADAEGALADLNASLSDAPEGTSESIARLVDQHAQTVTLLRNTTARLEEGRIDVQRKEQAVAALSDRLAKQGAAGTGKEDRKVKLLVEMHELLVAAVKEFRDQLRDRVEEEASVIFKALSAEKDYDRLRINENYGLTIIHKDGTVVLNRSSGYEHVVALSLIAALQRCSPMSGPIITDSPFGRLDKTHKEHVLRALPQITDQVLLLVHDDELDRHVALSVLGTDLVAEHHLRRVAARHTDIESGVQS